MNHYQTHAKKAKADAHKKPSSTQLWPILHVDPHRVSRLGQTFGQRKFLDVCASHTPRSKLLHPVRWFNLLCTNTDFCWQMQSTRLCVATALHTSTLLDTWSNMSCDSYGDVLDVQSGHSSRLQKNNKNNHRLPHIVACICVIIKDCQKLHWYGQGYNN